MAKSNMTFKARLSLNPEKGGAWKADVSLVKSEQNGLGGFDPVIVLENTTAWKNASAAKRWIKAVVQRETPRKSVKLNATAFGENEKPIAFAGELTYKA